jgi:hypothetical protein
MRNLSFVGGVELRALDFELLNFASNPLLCLCIVLETCTFLSHLVHAHRQRRHCCIVSPLQLVAQTRMNTTAQHSNQHEWRYTIWIVIATFVKAKSLDVRRHTTPSAVARHCAANKHLETQQSVLNRILSIPRERVR